MIHLSTRSAASAITLALACGAVVPSALSQTYRDSSGTVVPGVVLVDPSGVGAIGTASNPMKISGSFSASLSGFAPTPAYASLSVPAINTSYNVALPSGSVVIVYNTGSNDAYVKLGASGVTASAANDVVKAGGWMAFTVGSNTYLAAYATAGATSLTLSAGSGLPTGAGGGGGSGGSLTWPGTASAANYGTAPSGTVPGVNAFVTNFPSLQPISAASLPLPTGAAQETGNLATIATNTGAVVTNTARTAAGTTAAAALPVQGVTGGVALKTDGSATTQPVSAASLPLPAGAATGAAQTNVQSAPGTAQTTALTVQGNATGIPLPDNQTQINGVAISTGAGATGTGTQRVGVAQDTTTIAGSAPGTAGTPSANVISMQGVAGGQPVPISGTVSASIGNFAPTPAYATLAVSTTSARVVTPSGTTALVYNTGSNDAYVTLGGSGVTATTTADVVKAGGWMQFTLGSNTYIAAITASGSTSLVISGGAGIAAGSGGASAAGTLTWPGTAGTANLGTLGSGTVPSVNAYIVGGGGSLTWPGTAAASTYGTAPTGTVPGVNAAITNASVAITAAALPLPAGAATSALQPTNAAQASTTSGQTGHLIMGAVTAAAPTYTTAQTNPLSLTTAGALRVDATATTQPISGSLTNISGTISLPTGAATNAAQTNVQSAPGTAQTVALTVQGNASGIAVPVSAAALPLPSGAATSALQTTGNSSLATIATNTTGAATAALQTTGNATLATIAANTSSPDVGTANFAPGQSTSISTTAAVLVAARTGAVGTGRVAVTIKNRGSAAVFLGGSSVTATTGYQLDPGESVTIMTTAAIYAIVASGTGSATWWETY